MEARAFFYLTYPPHPSCSLLVCLCVCLFVWLAGWLAGWLHRFDNRVCQADVDEALRLMRCSKSSLIDRGGEGGGAGGGRREDPVSLAHRLICEEARRVLGRSPGLAVVELPFGRLQQVVAKYNIKVCVGRGGAMCGWGRMRGQQRVQSCVACCGWVAMMCLSPGSAAD